MNSWQNERPHKRCIYVRFGGFFYLLAAKQGFISSESLEEPYAWGGPIVMNTREELQKAFDDLKKGTFLRDKISYD